MIERVGWNGQHFALPDGTVFSPSGAQQPDIVFQRIPRRCSPRGTFKGWKRKVARRLAGQALAEFVLCLAFAAPLLALTNRVGNFGFELVGGKGTGKSSLQQLMSSVLGALQGEDGHYWVSFDATPNALEQSMAGFSDLPLILEEANLFVAGETARTRGNNFKALAFRLGGGSEKARFDQGQPKEFRLIFLTSSNERLAKLMNINSEAARAAEDRLITLPIEGRPHGVLDFVPSGTANASQFIADLVAAADAHHGHAIRRFLSHLVQERADDERRLRAEIVRRMASFREKAGVDPNAGSAVRVADAFGLVFAAGALAKRYGALPRAFRTGGHSQRLFSSGPQSGPQVAADVGERWRRMPNH